MNDYPVRNIQEPVVCQIRSSIFLKNNFKNVKKLICVFSCFCKFFYHIVFGCRTRNDSINMNGVQLYGSWNMTGKINYVA